MLLLTLGLLKGPLGIVVRPRRARSTAQRRQEKNTKP
jgi:hypothetical protein